jgi:predicted CXXCH cytochrome family protein
VKPGDGSNHAPFAKGSCLDCHDAHGSNVPGMLVADQKSLCLKCHTKEAKGAAAARSVHGAFAAGDCTKCHSPHKAALKDLLLAPSPDQCFTCHKAVKDKIASQKPHSPVDDCLTCHSPHHSPQPKLASQPVTQLCGQCHDTKEGGFGAAHLGIATAALECMSCHDPHASKDAKLFKATMHAPFAARDCSACHVSPAGARK